MTQRSPPPESKQLKPRSTPDLMRAFQGDADEADRRAIAEELGARGAVEVIPVLIELVIRSTDDGAPDDTAVYALEQLGALAVEPVLGHLASTSPRNKLYLYWCEVLAKSGVRDDRIYSALMDVFAHSPDFAASCFGFYGDARALPLLHRALERHVVTDDLLVDHAVLEYERAILQLGGALTERGREIVDRYRGSLPRFDRAD